MSAVLLTLDRGNTSLDVMLHTSTPQRWRAPAADQGAVLAVLADLSPVPARALGSTVVPTGLAAAATVLEERGVRLELAGRDLPCPLTLHYSTPSTLGTDRWLCALAAHAEHGACVVVQCGTAVTVDAVDASGCFLGGAIAPGLRALADGLAIAAPGLPRAVAPRCAAVPALTSQTCVEAGVLLTFCGGVERLVQDVAAVLPANAPRLVTGGDAATYLEHGRLPLVLVQDLLHRGLRCLSQVRALRS